MKKVSSCLFFILVFIGISSFFLHNEVRAVSAADWRAGNILDDFSFTDANSMSVQDVQNFLDSKINCDINGVKPSELGGGTRAQYGASRGNPAPFTCLNKYYEVPKTSPNPSAPISNYGLASPPAGSQSAAQLIVNSAKKYSISPKVLLVKLATESPGPLTSDEWPLKSQYSYAMGARCPDSGPGGAANCDVNYSGFSIQMDEAAKLLRGYLDNMSQSWWPYKKPFQTNNILWNVVERGCGSGNVYIESKATAALYTYTPYQPNQAALNNMYGTGDNCSAYGNRNFWRVFRDWFGTGESYDWQLVDQKVFRDAGRTQSLSYYPSVKPNTKVYVQLKIKNIGSNTWNGMTRIATNNPPGKSSIFYDPADWLSSNRPASLVEGTVAPGNIGTFNFTMIVPPTTETTYTEHFILVQDGVKIFKNIGLNITLDVTNPLTNVRSPQKAFGVGSRLSPGEFVLSPDANTVLFMQRDGNLVLYSSFRPIWSSGTGGNPGSFLTLQGDGNLVLYTPGMKALWSSSTPGTESNSLNLQSDANLVLYANNQPTWSSVTSQIQSQFEIVNPRLLSNSLLMPGQRIETANRKYSLILQEDGNLVLYTSSMKPLWNSQTDGKRVQHLTMQSDGNLVLYDTNSKPIWHSHTNGKGSSRLVIQEDANLVIYHDGGTATWATYTNP